MYLRLDIQTGPEAPWTTREFEGATIRVGRNPALELALADGEAEPNGRVSHDHAVFELRPDGLFVRDLNSKNGTYVDGQLVREQQLRVGKCISLGRKGPKLRVLDFRPPKVVMASPLDRMEAPAVNAPSGGPAADLPEPAAPPPKWQGAAEQPLVNPLPALNPRPSISKPTPWAASSALSSTRQFVIAALQRQGRRWKVFAGLSTAGLLVLAVALVTQESSDKAGSRVHRNLLQSTVWVVCRTPSGQLASVGTGALVDRSRRLVLTAAHVVKGVTEVELYEPLYSQDGRFVVETQAYRDLVLARKGRKATILARDELRDLAVLQVDSLWDRAVALRLAAASAEPGESVHSLGALPRGFDAFWVYASGTVRQVHREPYAWGNPLRDASGQPVVVGGQPMWETYNRARVVVTHSPINPGDSGGPLVNNRSELVGVSHGILEGVQGLSMFIDVSEVRHILSQLP